MFGYVSVCALSYLLLWKPESACLGTCYDMIRSNSNTVYMPSARVVAIIARKLLKVSDRHNVGEKYPKAESNRCRAPSEAFKGNSGPIPEGMARQKRRGSKYRASPVRGT